MKNYYLLILMLSITISALGQQKDKAGIIEVEGGTGFYYETILKDAQHVNEMMTQEEPRVTVTMDQSIYDLPNKVDLYERVWTNPVISQGNAGTCWDFSTISFYESEIYRMTGKQVKLSEIFIAYNEYIEKARRFVQERGNSLFSEGSEGNAVARMAIMYGLMPESAYTGLINGRKYHDHEPMVAEMSAYLNSLKESNAWNEELVLETIKKIMNHHLGTPPETFTVEGKEYTPMEYMNDYLKLDPSEFVEILSFKQKPYWEQVEYTVPDNWWHSDDYYNIPLDDYMDALKEAIKNGYSVSIGGDVSEAGFLRETQCAMIPDFDIPSEYITEDARAFRFDNQTTTDDHGMHLVGYLENYKGDGKDWYLIKDSGSGSRNNGEDKPEFGYYFFHEDYIKLKMMGFTVHKDAVKDILKKFK